jgi:hypothetical protein
MHVDSHAGKIPTLSKALSHHARINILEFSGVDIWGTATHFPASAPGGAVGLTVSLAMGFTVCLTRMCLCHVSTLRIEKTSDLE